MSWEDWNESINKLDTRTKTAEEKDADKCSAQKLELNKYNRGRQTWNLQDNTNDQPKETRAHKV